MLTKVANYVAQKVWNENRAQIEQVVYQSYVPKSYNRTGEFKDARIETRKALIAYGRVLDQIINACEDKLAEVEE